MHLRLCGHLVNLANFARCSHAVATGGFMPTEFKEQYRRLIPLQRLGQRKVLVLILPPSLS